MIKLLLSRIKLYRKLKGGKWCGVMTFTDGNQIVYWKREDDLRDENYSVFSVEEY
ncbi:hypothetical protein [Lysinibacillus sp. Bpr_S20]|uniref:hypothetical protein n=1 Tax=Lysinibacillus sp. Bpr_S20 TaxID=2933964 RepID=UPI0020117244|nr:hypothetical protein [Lysinibacillus sp. Bpr_S20]MCL1700782.1 hypothetical protein [Lysinibacillus sp. Bpr_S20]